MSGTAAGSTAAAAGAARKYGGSDPKCEVCNTTVYAVEKMVVEGRSIHKACFTCAHCKRSLTLTNFAMVNKTWYCKPHYIELFKNSGGKYDVFGAFNSGPNKVPRVSTEPVTVSVTTTATVIPEKEDTKVEEEINVDQEEDLIESPPPPPPTTTTTTTTTNNNNNNNNSAASTHKDLIPPELRKRFRDNHQESVFHFADIGLLNDEETEFLVKQASEIPIEALDEIVQSARAQTTAGVIEPLPKSLILSGDQVSQGKEKWRTLGLSAIQQGQVAVVVLAGGQGTRLGFEGPKGMYDIGLPSKKSLFQLQAERILHNQKIAQAPDNRAVLYFVMTSPLNDQQTRDFFKEHDFFGMEPANVVFFTQGTLPCVTDEPKASIILESKNVISTAPDGNGGVYTSLRSSGNLDKMKERGIEWIHIVSIDNALINTADPVFVGCCIENQVEAGNCTVSKLSWNEPVGVMALRDGKYHVVEYSEINESMAKEQDPETQGLLYGSANICNHMFSLDFIMNKGLPGLQKIYHIARKKIPFADPVTGVTITPTVNTGIKLELFVFDMYLCASKMIVLETSRGSTFAPVKNANGNDSPSTALQAISSLHKSWLLKAGAILVGSDDQAVCEISPQIATDEYEFLAKEKSPVQGLKMVLPLLFRHISSLEIDSSTGSNIIPVPSHPKVQVVIDPYASFNIFELIEEEEVRTTKAQSIAILEEKQDLIESDKALEILKMIRNIDINNTTPMQALFILEELRRLALE